jgi:t-SNARE complex subunit (syntaxin)
MDKIIASIPQLLEELEGKVQMVANKQIDFLFECNDIQSLNSSEEIRNYVDEVVIEIAALKEKKKKINKDNLNKLWIDKSNDN